MKKLPVEIAGRNFEVFTRSLLGGNWTGASGAGEPQPSGKVAICVFTRRCIQPLAVFTAHLDVEQGQLAGLYCLFRFHFWPLLSPSHISEPR